MKTKCTRTLINTRRNESFLTQNSNHFSRNLRLGRRDRTRKWFRFVRASGQDEAAWVGERNDPSIGRTKSRQMSLLTAVLRLPAGVPSGAPLVSWWCPSSIPGVSQWLPNLLITRRVVVWVNIAFPPVTSHLTLSQLSRSSH